MVRSILIGSACLGAFACSWVTDLDGLRPASDASINGIDAGSDATPLVDATIDGDATGPWTPAALDQKKTLALWLEGSPSNVLLNQGAVAVWKDLSSNHNDAKAGGLKPAVAPAAIKGHDAVDFTPIKCTMTVTDAPSLQFASDEIFVSVVARVTAGTGFFFSKAKTVPSGGGQAYASGLEVFATKTTVDGGVEMSPGAHLDPMQAITWSGPVFNDSSYHLVTVRRTKSSLAVTVDSGPAQGTPVGATDVSLPGVDVYIGAFLYGAIAPPTDLAIAELVIVHDKGGVSDTDAGALVSYLKAKYGL